MNVTCPECRSVFRVDPSKLPAASVRARCAVCGGLITVTPSASVRDEFAPGPRPSTERTPGDLSGGASGRSFARPDAQRPAADLTTVPNTTPATPRPASPFRTSTGAPVAPPQPPAIAAASPPGSATRGGVAPTHPAPRPPAQPQPPAVARPPAADVAAPNLGAATAAALLGRVDAPTGGAAPSGASGRGPAGPPARPPSPARPAMPFVRPGGGGTPPQPAAGPGFASFGARATPPAGQNAPRRPINPFLANDPNAKARRLARALISDMVTYFPEKREEALRSGTLKQVFEEEIKKSYEEYVAQVGREFAETTPHFQDALNEILAGGRKLF
ncbi:MAG: zinc-ribbon domain-containing protein [Gemmatimonadaceae bacterium]